MVKWNSLLLGMPRLSASKINVSAWDSLQLGMDEVRACVFQLLDRDQKWETVLLGEVSVMHSAAVRSLLFVYPHCVPMFDEETS